MIGWEGPESALVAISQAAKAFAKQKACLRT